MQAICGTMGCIEERIADSVVHYIVSHGTAIIDSQVFWQLGFDMLKHANTTGVIDKGSDYGMHKLMRVQEHSQICLPARPLTHLASSF